MLKGSSNPRIHIPKGTRYNRLIVIKEVAPRVSAAGNKTRMFKCKCDCGNITEVQIGNLRNGHTTSCGCQQYVNVTTHGLYRHPVHRVWIAMHHRCYNPANEYYAEYGGRGIKVWKKWHGPEGMKRFAQWADKSGYAKGLEIDRIDNDGDYRPSNCRWVNRTGNIRNRSNTKYVVFQGKRITFAELWDKFGKVKFTTAYMRYKKGHPIMIALTAPVGSL